MSNTAHHTGGRVELPVAARSKWRFNLWLEEYDETVFWMECSLGEFVQRDVLFFSLVACIETFSCLMLVGSTEDRLAILGSVLVATVASAFAVLAKHSYVKYRTFWIFTLRMVKSLIMSALAIWGFLVPSQQYQGTQQSQHSSGLMLCVTLLVYYIQALGHPLPFLWYSLLTTLTTTGTLQTCLVPATRLIRGSEPLFSFVVRAYWFLNTMFSTIIQVFALVNWNPVDTVCHTRPEVVMVTFAFMLLCWWVPLVMMYTSEHRAKRKFMQQMHNKDPADFQIPTPFLYMMTMPVAVLLWGLSDSGTALET